ncbi:MAG TPA: NAD-dependent protein deacetylase [Trueperaceae bacterium]|nr:NAD-dependent protein deacetylase [Trueperaceae bacterium]
MERSPRPPAEAVIARRELSADPLDALARLLAGRRVLVLSGAGLSTESGIPDYRGPDSARRKGSPITYQEFTRSEAARRRYWARSFLGWPAMRDKRPNDGHRAVARLEQAGAVCGVLTQNVDGLHHAAGSRRVLELHGALATIRCLRCGRLESRDALQRRLAAANPHVGARDVAMAPDGDAELAPSQEDGFRLVACRGCGGVLKPDVVFFGENVPRPRVARSWAMLEEAGALLVLGSSLAVRSGYRYVAHAAAEGVPVAIINDGPTRGDDVASLRVAGRLGRVLPALAERLLGQRPLD